MHRAELRQQLAIASGTDPEPRFQFARSFGNFGRLHTLNRDHVKAEEAFQQALKIQDEVVKQDQANPEY